MKVLSCICGFVGVLLLLMAIATTAWLESDGYRQGLWSECKIGENNTLECYNNGFNDTGVPDANATSDSKLPDSNNTVPAAPTAAAAGDEQPTTVAEQLEASSEAPTMPDVPDGGNAKARAKRFIGDNKGLRDWLVGCAALCLIGVILAFIGSILCAIGLCSTSYRHKFKFYKAALYFFVFSALALIIALIVFPVMFLQEVHTLGRSQWFFGWAYGVAWGATVFIIGAALLLIIDKDTEEIFYSEKTYYPETETDA